MPVTPKLHASISSKIALLLSLCANLSWNNPAFAGAQDTIYSQNNIPLSGPAKIVPGLTSFKGGSVDANNVNAALLAAGSYESYLRWIMASQQNTNNYVLSISDMRALFQNDSRSLAVLNDWVVNQQNVALYFERMSSGGFTPRIVPRPNVAENANESGSRRGFVSNVLPSATPDPNRSNGTGTATERTNLGGSVAHPNRP